MLVRIIKMIKSMLILGQIRLNEGYLCSTGLGKDPGGLEPPAEASNRKKTPLIFNHDVHSKAVPSANFVICFLFLNCSDLPLYVY